MRSSGSIVVTGASGWVGRTLLDHLCRLLPPVDIESRLRAFASNSGAVNLAGGRSIAVQPLTTLPDLVAREGCAAVLHAAFLTPDRCAVVGRDLYIATNRSITELVCTALRASPQARVVLFSSGAAALVESDSFACSADTRLYGRLKLDEERLLQAITPTLVLRIYALSGRYIREPRRYALGDFLHQALHGQPVLLRSTSQIIRGYVHADCLAELALRWLISDLAAPEQPVNAVSHELDLVSLARSVSALFGDRGVRMPEQTGLNPSCYSASPATFLAMLSQFQISVPSLEQQIRDTALAFPPADAAQA